MPLTNVMKNRIIDASDGKAQNCSIGPTAWLGLSTTLPTAAGGNITEPSGNNYKRVLLGNYSQGLTQKMGSAANGVAVNAVDVHFEEATGAWGTCAYAVLFDAQNGGNLIAWAQLETAISPVANTVPIIKAGDLEISIT